MGFVQHIQVIILPENLSLNKAEEQNEKKPRIFKKIPASYARSSESGLLDQFSFKNLEIHTLPKNLSQN
jgi:hypothetical protein